MATTAPSKNSDDYTIVRRIPTGAEYYRLRTNAGLSPPPYGTDIYKRQVEDGLQRSVAVFCAVHVPTGEIVGMARLIGDGIMDLVVVDMAVEPAHQRRGLGTRIMQALTAFIEETAPFACVCLVADQPGGPPLYAKYGFRLTTPRSVGMIRFKIADAIREQKEAVEKGSPERPFDEMKGKYNI